MLNVVELLNVKPDGTYSDHWTLKSYKARRIQHAPHPSLTFQSTVLHNNAASSTIHAICQSDSSC
jgi:hypothetical protein